MTYEEVVETICGIRRFGNMSGEEISGRMLEELGRPQDGIKLIHIAGTNGKGSVSAFLCAILQAAGFRTGMFTSPHLVDFGERIRVDGEQITKEAVRRIGEKLLAQDFGVHPTMFDYCLVMALLYFKEQGCEVIVLETGIGGRLDSTNAVGVPEVCVLTKIGYDHMTVLGNTLGQIAREKAGIIKPGVSVVAESQCEEVRQVFRETAKHTEVRRYREVDPGRMHDFKYVNGIQEFSFGTYEGLRMHMPGVYQYENAAAAILAAEEFFARAGVPKGADLRACIHDGIFAARWPGRMEIIRTEPFLLLDGAHNSNGVSALAESLKILFPGEKFHFIMGVMADKDYAQMVELLLPLAIDFVAVTVDDARALAAEELSDFIRRSGVPANCADSVGDCLLKGQHHTAHKTVAFGSLYFIGEMKRLLGHL